MSASADTGQDTSASRLAAVETRVVLVVDDDPAVTDALTELLEGEGYDVVAASNGLTALAHLRNGLRPCAILLDLMMPVMDGWDFRQQQLRDPELCELPVVVITAAGFSVTSVKAQFGDIEFLPKPLPEQQLLEAIQRCCDKLT